MVEADIFVLCLNSSSLPSNVREIGIVGNTAILLHKICAKEILLRIISEPPMFHTVACKEFTGCYLI